MIPGFSRANVHEFDHIHKSPAGFLAKFAVLKMLMIAGTAPANFFQYGSTRIPNDKTLYTGRIH